MTKIINLFAGPGAGKSTTAAGLFYLLKCKGINCELVHEFAKDLTWRNMRDRLAIQPYVFGKQLERVESLIGKVDYIITDSPLLLSSIYLSENDYGGIHFHNTVIHTFKNHDNINYFLTRSKDYLQVGRSQTLAQAQLIDHRIKELLQKESIEYSTVAGNADAPYVISKQLDTRN